LISIAEATRSLIAGQVFSGFQNTGQSPAPEAAAATGRFLAVEHHVCVRVALPAIK